MSTTFEKKDFGPIKTLVTNKSFTDNPNGVRPGEKSFEADLRRSLGLVQRFDPKKEFIIAQRLGGLNTLVQVVGDGDLRWQYSEEENYCSKILFRTKDLYDSLIIPKSGVIAKDGQLLTAENSATLIMSADCPAVYLDAGEYFAIVHAAREVLYNDESGASGLKNTLDKLKELGVNMNDVFALASHGIGSELYKYPLSGNWAEVNRKRHDAFQDLFGEKSVYEDGDWTHIDLMEVIASQLEKAGVSHFQLDRRCTASATGPDGERMYPSFKLGDKKERYCAFRWK